MDRQFFARFIGRYRSSLLLILLASSLFNLLVFAGSAYLMLVYDSVLPSRSLATLFGLFGLIIIAYLFQFIFDTLRSEGLLGVAQGVYRDLAPAVGHAVAMRPFRDKPGEGDGLQPLRDLDQLYAFLTGPGPTAMLDLPWVVVFMAILFALHWWLGLTALLGVIVLIGIALWTSRVSGTGTHELARLGNQRTAARLAQLRFAEAAIGMGMTARLQASTLRSEHEHLATQSLYSRMMTRLGAAGRGSRLLLQSTILTVGALLVINDKASAGVIFASSILAGRALAPVDHLIASWRGYAAARDGWTRIVGAITTYGAAPARAVALSRPSGTIVMTDVWVVPPGRGAPVVNGVSLTLAPGQAVALIGPSAAGKTSLVKALLGIWPTSRGEIRIAGATHAQWDAEALGAHFGYVPQVVELMAGTVGENIARFDPAATSEAIIAAARAAAMHETILGFPNGYETPMSAGGNELSAGMRQRIGLARALYGDPFLLVLDEANSNLDAAGDVALSDAIRTVRAREGIVVMVTHRPATLGPLSHVAVLSNGRLTDFGERDEVLARMTRRPTVLSGGKDGPRERAST